MLVLPALYVASSFPLRYALPLAVLEIGTFASPLLVADGGHALACRTIAYAVAYTGLVATIQFLKRRLVEAEREQHHMARVDPLTGLPTGARSTRRSPTASSGRVFTVLLADIDFFKQINDRRPHHG